MAHGGKSGTLGLTTRQLLYPSEIYALNRVLDESLHIKELRSDFPGKFVVFPSLFSKHSRTFHWMAVNQERWQITDSDKAKGKLLFTEVINALEKAFSQIIDEYRQEKSSDTKWNQLKEEERLSLEAKYLEKRWDEYISSMHGLDQYRKAADYIRLIVEKLIKNKSKKVKVANFPRLHKELLLLYEGNHQDKLLFLDGIVYRHLYLSHVGGNQHEIINYVKGRFYQDPPKEAGPKEKKVRETCHNFPWVKCNVLNDDGEDLVAEHWQCQEAFNLNNKHKYGKKFARDIFKPSEETALPDFQNILLNLFNPKQADFSRVLIKPLYDGWVKDKQCGAIWGNLTFLVDNANTLKAFTRSQKLKELKKLSYNLVRELQDSALSIILSQPIQPPYDLLDHFVKHLIILQDWERIVVFRKKGDVLEPQYCYQWKQEKSKQTWARCSGSNDNPAESACLGCMNWDGISKKTEKYLCWDGGMEMWNRALIPSISDEEEQILEPFRLAFEYPVTSVVPELEDDRSDLGRFYIRQQFEVLRGLMRKVRARRSALRNAAVSIMGRNMSHNIGSHVLARYAMSGKVRSPQVKQFARYLQERMDFIADVSTTNVFYSLPTQFYGEAMMGLVGDPSDSQKPGQEILLEYISGLSNTSVSIKRYEEADEDFTFASPGGRLGLQALYVMLENIARNTAKHSQVIQNEVTLYIDVSNSDKYEKYLEVRVWDDLSDATKTIGEDGQVKKPLPQWINGILKEEMIYDSGAINPNYWGIREIFLAAAYLRKIRLDELESLEALYANPPIIEAVSCVDKKNKERLGYRFYLENAELIYEIVKGKNWAKTDNKQGIVAIQVSSESKEDKAALNELKKAANLGVSHSYGIFSKGLFEKLTLPEKLGLPIMHLDRESLQDYPRDQKEREAYLARAWCEKFLKDRVGNEEWSLLWTQDKGANRGALDFRRKRHVGGIEESEKPDILLYHDHGKRDFACRNWGFYEAFYSRYPQYKMITVERDDDLHKSMFLQAALTRVIIMDERIQALLRKEDSETSMTWQEVFRRKNIIVPSIDSVDLDQVRANKGAFFEWLNGQQCDRRKTEKTFDFIVIHQTIIDKLRDVMGAANFDDKFLKVATSLGCEERIVVCSGRGDPRENLPKFARFIPVSGVLEFTVHSPSKLHLVNLLNHARQPRST